MADLSDVEAALVALLAASLLPPGYQVGDAVLSPSLGVRLRIFRGWPNGAGLDDDLAQNGDGPQGLPGYIVNLSVFSDPGGARTTTRYSREWGAAPPAPPSLLVSVSGTTATFAGQCSPSILAGIRLGIAAPAIMRCKAGDTPESVAATLAGLLSASGAQANGPGVTFPGGTQDIVARTGADAVATQEVRRQEQSFRVTVWAPTPQARDLVASAADVVLAEARGLDFPDGSQSSLLTARGTFVDDATQKSDLWRRDLRYSIEYPTISSQSQSRVLFPVADVNDTAQPPLLAP